jgi:hypothetical protein
MIELGLDLDPIKKFLAKLSLNPSYRAVGELYQFLEMCNLPITSEGNFRAYKRVNSNWTDMHTGTINNSVGQVVTMPRNEVDDDFNNGCSRGLHFGSKEYFGQSGFGNGDHRLIIVEIDPQNVVSVPKEYNFSKGRCCEYVVIEEVIDQGFNLPNSYVNTTPPQDFEDDVDNDDYEEEQEWEDEEVSYNPDSEHISLGHKKDKNGFWRDSLGRFV